MRLPANLYADLIGKPFAEGGRGPDAYDCLGMAITLQRRQGRYVPDFASSMDEFHRQFGDGILGPCSKLDAALPGCVVLLRTGINERHIGTMIDPYRMIHTMAGLTNGACIERAVTLPWAQRVLGYYMPEAR